MVFMVCISVKNTTYWWNVFKPKAHKVIWQGNIYFTKPSRNRKTYEFWCLLEDLIEKLPFIITLYFWFSKGNVCK